SDDAAIHLEETERLLPVTDHSGVVLGALETTLRQVVLHGGELGQVVAIDNPALPVTIVRSEDRPGRGGLGSRLLEQPAALYEKPLYLVVRSRVRFLRSCILRGDPEDACRDLVPLLLFGRRERHRLDVIEVWRESAGVDRVVQRAGWRHDAVAVVEQLC